MQMGRRRISLGVDLATLYSPREDPRYIAAPSGKRVVEFLVTVDGPDAPRLRRSRRSHGYTANVEV